jgi:hypothetical protein
MKMTLRACCQTGCLRTVSFFFGELTVRNFAPQLRVCIESHMLFNLFYSKSIENSSNSCDVGIDFLIFLPLPLPFAFALALAAAAAASCESCDTLSRVGLLTRLERRGSALTSLSFEPLELLFGDDMLSVLDSCDSKVSS